MIRGFAIVAVVQVTLIVYCILGVGIQLRLQREAVYFAELDQEGFYWLAKAIRDLGIFLLPIPAIWFFVARQNHLADSPRLSDTTLLISGAGICLLLLCLAAAATDRIYAFPVIIIPTSPE